MTPIECLARLCALVRPPYYPLTRFHGVLAPRARLRGAVVPRLPNVASCSRKCSAVSSKVSESDCAKELGASGRGSVELTQQVSTSSSAKGQRASACGSLEATSKTSTSSSLCSSVVEATSKLSPSSCALGLIERRLIHRSVLRCFWLMLSVPIKVEAQAAYNVPSVKHLDRIRGGLLYAATSAVPWAILHERTFEHDVMMCGHCGGRLRLKAVRVDPRVAMRVLASVTRLERELEARAHPWVQLVVAVVVDWA